MLLEAIGSQFARNLKREGFSHNPARSQSIAYFSQSANQRKLDALNVLKALTVEQRCEASTLGHIDDVERPDCAVIDLDPDESLPWKSVIRAAFEVRAVLDDLGLKSWVKTTGGKGIHVCFPIVRRTSTVPN